MPAVVITFIDGEVLHAETPELTFELPIIEAEVRTVGANSEFALLPLTAIRQMVVGDVLPAPPEDVLGTWDRAVFRFLDGAALRVLIAPDAFLGRHGGVWRAVEPGSREARTLALPYAALKGVFRVREWDGRPLEERQVTDQDAPTHLEILARILSGEGPRTGSNGAASPRLLQRARRMPAPER